MAKYQLVRGHRFPNLPWFFKEKLEESLDHVPDDGDIIVASYPKTGTTWLQYNILQIVTKAEKFPSFEENIEETFPFIDIVGSAKIKSMESPRMYKHHSPYNLVQKNDKAKTIYIYRNPADTYVSFFHFMQSLSKSPIEFEPFFEDFLSGDIAYGSYIDHVLSFFARKEDSNLLLVSYEKLQANRKEEILRIATFLGEEHARNLLEDESLLLKVMEHTSFDYMKKRLYFSHSAFRNKSKLNEEELKRINFFRKGVVGDGKNSLTAEQMKRIRDLVVEKVKDTELLHEWLKD